MSSRGRKRVVLNSHRFLRDISPTVLSELGIDDETSYTPRGESEPGLYDVIRNGGHRIILPHRIRRE